MKKYLEKFGLLKEYVVYFKSAQVKYSKTKEKEHKPISFKVWKNGFSLLEKKSLVDVSAPFLKIKRG